MLLQENIMISARLARKRDNLNVKSRARECFLCPLYEHNYLLHFNDNFVQKGLFIPMVILSENNYLCGSKLGDIFDS